MILDQNSAFSHDVMTKNTLKLQYYPFPKQALVFTCLLLKSFENAVGKGEIAYNKFYMGFYKENLRIFPVLAIRPRLKKILHGASSCGPSKEV